MHLPELLKLDLGTVDDHLADSSSLHWNGMGKVPDDSCVSPQDDAVTDGYDSQLHQPTYDTDEVDETTHST